MFQRMQCEYFLNNWFCNMKILAFSFKVGGGGEIEVLIVFGRGEKEKSICTLLTKQWPYIA